MEQREGLIGVPILAAGRLEYEIGSLRIFVMQFGRFECEWFRIFNLAFCWEEPWWPK